TSAGAFRQVPLLLIDLETKEGVTGRTYLFCYLRAAVPAVMSLLSEIEQIVKGAAINPAGLWAKLAQRFTLRGVQGLAGIALAGFDLARWDAVAIPDELLPAQLHKATPRPIPAYNSCGLGLTDDLGALADEADKLLARGFRAIKLRLGYPTVQA